MAVTRPAIVVVRDPDRAAARGGCRRPGRSTQWRRMITIAARGIRIPNWGLMIAATVVRIAARSDRPRHSSRTARRRTSVPTESTWAQTALSNQVTGTRRKTAGGGERASAARAQLGGQGEDGQGEAQVGDDRRQLEEVADRDGERLGDEPEPPQDVEVARACSRRRSGGRRGPTARSGRAPSPIR